MQVMHEGASSPPVPSTAAAAIGALTELNARLAPALGMIRGVTHAEYIKSHADGRFYFLEIAARVGGAFIADLVATSTGVNLWREWARLEVASLRDEAYTLPPTFETYSGSVLCLARPPSLTPRPSTPRKSSTA